MSAPRSSGPSPELRAQLLAAVSREPARPRQASAPRRAACVAAGAAWMIAVAIALGHRLGARPPSFVLALTVAWGAIALVATWALVARGRSMLGRPRTTLVTVLLATPVAMITALGAAYAVWPEAQLLACPPRVHVMCFVSALVMAAGPLAAFAFVRRGSDPVHPAVTGAALATCAGAWASLASLAHCPYASLEHLVVAHVLPVAALTAVGTLALARVVALRRTR